MGLRGKAIATEGPILMCLVCSAISASGRNPSLPASAVQIASNPASSAALAAAGTSRRLRVERPVSSFMSESPLNPENQGEGDANKAPARLKRDVTRTRPQPQSLNPPTSYCGGLLERATATARAGK